MVKRARYLRHQVTMTRTATDNGDDTNRRGERGQGPKTIYIGVVAEGALDADKFRFLLKTVTKSDAFSYLQQDFLT